MPNCRKCGHVTQGDALACPSCGAIYAKADAHFAAERTKLEAQQAAAQRAADANARQALAMSVCQQCGYIGKRKRITRGSFLLEIALYLLGLVLVGSILGIVWGVTVLVATFAYSIWRIASRYYACAKCESPQIIPGDSPKGREALKAAGLLP